MPDARGALRGRPSVRAAIVAHARRDSPRECCGLLLGEGGSILFALPMGFIATFNPGMALAIGQGMNAYLGGLPDSLYMLFGTGYLGYTAARQWGKMAGTDK